MMAETIGEKGTTERKLESFRVKALEALSRIKRAEAEMPGLEFTRLPWQDISPVREAARRLSGLGNFLLLGIGGSALGPKCILEALSPFHNQRPDKRQRPKVFIYENADPFTLESILSSLDINKTGINVISKSGGTSETIAAFMVLYDLMEKSIGREAADRFVLTTDPEKGDLRTLAGKGMASLSVPPGVGGRYSVLSPVGLLLAEVIGADTEGLLRGARDAHELCTREEFWENPAIMASVLIYVMQRDEGRKIDVLIPYSDRLKSFSEWYCQLWSESLGKQGRGLTPYPSVGTTDQHSQVQLWMEGPQDKVVIFIRVEDHEADFTIPDVFGGYGSMSFLRGHGLAELINAEEEATELALAKNGRPSMTITIPRLDAYHLGQLFYFFEIVTVLTGFFLEINPFDQPSVEEGKRLTFGLMGKKGFEDKKKEVVEARDKKSCFKV